MLGAVDRFVAGILGAVVQVQNLVTAFVLSAFVALALRALVVMALDRSRGPWALVPQVPAAPFFGVLGVVYGVFAAPLLAWNAGALGVAALAAGMVAGSLLLRRGPGERRLPSLTGLLARAVVVLSLLLLACVTLMRAGFLALTQDRPVMLVEVTGETGRQTVRWAPADAPHREEALETHRVLFKTPEGVAVSEAWVYGDQVAVKGRVLRLAPLLNAAGVPNLFELQFAHNGYLTFDRHNTYPHRAFPLPPSGPLAVHRWWRPVQTALLERWERGTAEGSGWAVRSATTESTFFPLVDEGGTPVRRTYRLVLTPGGLSAS